MKNVLYISLQSDGTTGGTICRENNQLALKSTGNNIFFYKMQITKNLILRTIFFLQGYKCGLNKKNSRNILRIFRTKNIDVVFFDLSIFGKLLPIIKREYPNVIVVSFFHNCEYQLEKTISKRCNFFIRKLKEYFIYKNERISFLYSDICIFLNKRDYYTCLKTYGSAQKGINKFTPIVLMNRYKPSIYNYDKVPYKLLFVGSYFLPNINGLKWFCESVMPYVDYELDIIGKKFDGKQFLDFINIEKHPNVHCRGYVDDLNYEYFQSDIVVQPVFEGSGMKTKTAECLMFGKALITTTEGLEGYELYNIDNIYCCNSSNEFIKVLNELKLKRIKNFYPKLHKIFLDKYSLSARENFYKNMFNNMC